MNGIIVVLFRILLSNVSILGGGISQIAKVWGEWCVVISHLHKLKIFLKNIHTYINKKNLKNKNF